MADTSIAITAGTGTNVDTRTEGTNGNHRQVIVIGDPATNAGVAPVDATNGLSVDVKASALPTGAATSAKQDTGNTSLGTIAGSVSGTEMQVDVVAALPAGTNAIGKLAANSGVDIGDVDVTSVVPGTGATNLGKAIDTATGATDTGVLALATRDDALSALTPIEGDNVQLRTDSTGALWVKPSGTVTVDGSGVTQPVSNAGITTIAGAVSGTEMQVDVLTMPTVTVNAHAVTNAGTFAVQVDGAALTSLQLIDDTIATDGSAAPTKGVLIAGQDGTNAQTIKTDTNGELQVDVLTMPTTTVTATDLDVRPLVNTDVVTAELSAVDNAVLDTIAAKDFATQTTLAAINAKMVSGTDIGDVTLTAGSAAVGSILPPDTDVTAHTNYARKYYTNAGAVTDGIVWSPAAGKRWHVVTMYIQTSAAATITLEDDKAAGDEPVWKGEISANSGVTLSFTEHYPMASGEDAADLLVTTSAGNIYITCVGYEI